ncbi:PAQR family membrane homeostasis protein TrhA [Sediminibacillus massiliensis]|uniref:PAQR family membrane homeostasis protein TrhA n=1 Tax=Sediminibacillus massiliensis TaxID=1926277 RepID=UPI00098851A1|nr:hemolysin III family protein [Sediminibacillus massiliensis]
MAQTHTFTKGEEIANSVTHGIGALLSIAALVTLIIHASLYGTFWHLTSFTLFGLTMVLLYVSSTFVHALPKGKAKDIFEILDHSAIYFFIAGTYTPYLFLAVDGWIGWTLFGVVWGLAIAGTIFKCFFVKKFLFVSTIGYIVIGWQIVFAWQILVKNVPYNGMLFLVIGGLLYTLGSIFYVWRGFKFHHAVWHLFVLGGSIFHFFSVILYLG